VINKWILVGRVGKWHSVALAIFETLRLHLAFSAWNNPTAERSLWTTTLLIASIDLQSRKLNQQATVSYSGCSTVTGWRTLLVMPNKPFLPKPFLPISRSIRWASSISSTSFVRRALISFSAEAATPWYFRHLASNLVIRSPWSAAQPNLQNYHPAQTY